MKKNNNFLKAVYLNDIKLFQKEVSSSIIKSFRNNKELVYFNDNWANFVEKILLDNGKYFGRLLKYMSKYDSAYSEDTKLYIENTLKVLYFCLINNFKIYNKEKTNLNLDDFNKYDNLEKLLFIQ